MFPLSGLDFRRCAPGQPGLGGRRVFPDSCHPRTYAAVNVREFSMVLCCIAYYVLFYFITLHYMTLRYVTLRYVTLRCVTLR